MALGFTRPPTFGSNVNPSTGASTTYTPPVGSSFQTQNTPTPYAPGYAQTPTPSYMKTPQQMQYESTAQAAARAAAAQSLPDILYGGQERARYDAQIPFVDANYGQRESALRADYGANMRNADLDLNAIGVRRGAANRDAGYYQGLLELMPYYANLSGKERERALGEARRQGHMERLGIGSDYTNRGAYFSGMRSIKSYNSILGQQAQELGAEIGYGRDMLGQREKTMGLERSKAMTGDQLALLDIDAQKVGVSRDKYKAALEQGLASLGYDKFMSLEQLYRQRDAADFQTQKLIDQVLNSAYNAGNALQSGQVGGAYGGYN